MILKYKTNILVNIIIPHTVSGKYMDKIDNYVFR